LVVKGQKVAERKLENRPQKVERHTIDWKKKLKKGNSPERNITVGAPR